MLTGGAHKLRLGRPEEIPWLARQTRLTFARCGIVDPLSLDDYRAHGGLKGLARAIEIGPAATIETVTQSGLRGRGGAGFPTGIKWKTAADAKGERKFIVCNADEGDSGTFADRMLMEGDPFVLIEGMAIAGIAVGATKGYVYTRSEYPHAIATFDAALDVARRDGVLGANVLGSSHAFDIEQRVGAGAYVCGEETSLLDSLEGRRGQVRAKPPLPAHKGLFGMPTVINNVVSLASVPIILTEGAEFYREIGMGRSRGTMPIQLAGNIKYGGLFEAGFGVTLGELVNDIGGGTLTGRPVRAVQVGGPLGAYFPPSLFDTPFDYEAFAARDGLIGHGGIVVFDDTVDLAKQARFAMEFCAEESCGKCTPCRIGSVRGMEVIDRIAAGEQPEANLDLLRDLCHTMKFGSLCALGGFIPYPVMSALEHFPEDFRATPTGSRRMSPGCHSPRTREPRTMAHPWVARFRGDDGATRQRCSSRRHAMPLIKEIDYGTPESAATEQVTLTIDGQEVTVPAGTSVMRAAMDAGIRIPKLCATDSLDAFGSCRVCLVEIEGRAGTPASCTTPVAPGMKVSTTADRVRRVRRGVMELYLSDHPLDGMTSPVAGNSEFQEMAGLIGVRQVRYGQDGINHLHSEIDASNPYFQFDPARCIVCSRCVRACEDVQNTFALTIEGRGFESKVAAGAGENFLSVGMRLLRRLRAGLPDRVADREVGDRAGTARAFRHHHLRLLRRRLQLQGGDAGRHGGAHGAVEGRQGQPRPFLREGSLRLGLRHRTPTAS